MSPAEVARFLDAVESLKQRVILTVCYAAGLRVSEAVRLKLGARLAKAGATDPGVDIMEISRPDDLGRTASRANRSTSSSGY
jgi:integrase